MPETPESPAFLSVLPPAFAETRLPVPYRLLRSAEVGGGPASRYARSEAYRAAGFACQPFHRPLTKLLRAG
jgi:hypothetical protein